MAEYDPFEDREQRKIDAFDRAARQIQVRGLRFPITNHRQHPAIGVTADLNYRK
jgi:hypothetical protein